MERIRELEEALHYAIEWARRSKVLEKELSKVRGKLKRSEVLTEGWAKMIMGLEVQLS